MKKLEITVSSCSVCPYGIHIPELGVVYTHEGCDMEDRMYTALPAKGFPDWCPLPEATQ